MRPSESGIGAACFFCFKPTRTRRSAPAGSFSQLGREVTALSSADVMARCIGGAVADISPPQAYTYVYFTFTFISPESFDNTSTKLLRQRVLNTSVLFFEEGCGGVVLPTELLSGAA